MYSGKMVLSLLLDNLQGCFHMCVAQLVTCGVLVMCAIYCIDGWVDRFCEPC